MFRIDASVIATDGRKRHEFVSKSSPPLCFSEVLQQYDDQRKVYDQFYVAHGYSSDSVWASGPALNLIRLIFPTIRVARSPLVIWTDNDMHFLINNIRVALKEKWWDKWPRLIFESPAEGLSS